MMEWIFTQLGVPQNLHAQPWHIVFERNPPPWVWFFILVALVGVSFFSYSKIRGAKKAKAALSVFRAIALFVIFFLTTQPSLEWPQEKTEQDFVEVLVDRSTSLRVKDAVDAQGKLISRADFQDEIMKNSVWETLSKTHTLNWTAFNGNSTTIQNHTTLPLADGNRTLIASAIHETMQRNMGRPLSAIVLITDGRSQDSVNTTTIRQIQSLGIPIFTVPLGDPKGINDLSVVSVEAPQKVFVQDQIPIQAQISTKKPNEKIHVVLMDMNSKIKIDEQDAISDQDGKINLTMVGEPKNTGEMVWQVAIEGAPDADPSNDSQNVSITVMDRPIRVLYMDGWPRWEFRYLKNILLREKGIESSIMLLSADRDFAQEGTTPLSRLPKTEKEFSVFDVIILGDVPSGFLNATQQKGIKELVAKQGTGLLWIGGERSTPSSWRGSALEDLLPFRGSLDLPRLDQAAFMKPTESAARIGLLRLGNKQDDELGWPIEISPNGESWAKLEWAQRIDPRDVKPTTEILATAVSRGSVEKKQDGIQQESKQETPLVLTMRFGSGQTTYVATDETWRWRHGRGETLPERFWIQLIRHLARSGLRNSAGVGLQVDPPRATINQPVRISVDLAGVAVGGSVVVEAKNTKNGKTIDVELKADSGDQYSAVWIPSNDGDGVWNFRIRQPQIAESPEAKLTVMYEDQEQLNATPDHETLEKLSAATQGRVVEARDIETLEKLIPNRSFVTKIPIQIQLWNQWLVYVFLVLVLTIEWIGRRILQLM
jgi:hypothetical protein